MAIAEVATPRDMRLTHSQMACAKTCLRKHCLAYELGIRRDEEAKPLRMGSAVHLGLDLRAKGQDMQAVLSAVGGEYAQQAPAPTSDAYTDWAVEAMTVQTLLQLYGWRWAEQDESIEYVASELSFEIPIVNPDSGRAKRTHTLAGKIDKIIRLADGRLAIMEHKTTSWDIAPESDYWRRLRIDSQISIYFMAAQALGYDVQCILYDVIRKPSLRLKQVEELDEQGDKIVLDSDGTRIYLANGKPRQSADTAKGWVVLKRMETPVEFGARLHTEIVGNHEKYFQRQEITRLAADIEDAKYENHQMASLIHDCQRHGRWPRNTQACIGFGKCAYFDLCANSFDPFNAGSGPLPAGYTRVQNVHQELDES